MRKASKPSRCRIRNRKRRYLDDEDRTDPWPSDGVDGIDSGGADKAVASP